MRTALAALALLVGCYSPPPRPDWTDAPPPSDAPAWELCEGCEPQCSGTDPNIAECVDALGDLCPADCEPRCTYADGSVVDAPAYCLLGARRPSCDGGGGAHSCFRRF